MEKDHIPDQEYFDTYSEAIDVLSAFPFSGLTLKRQSQVLLVSVVLVLVTTSVVKLSSGTFGVKFDIDDAAIFGYVMISVCVFFIVSFVLSASGDIKTYFDKAVQGKFKLRSLNYKVLQRSIRLNNEASRVFEIADKKSSEMESIIEEQNEIWDRYWDQTSALSEQLDIEVENNNFDKALEISDQLETIHRKWEEEIEPYRELIDAETEESNSRYSKAENISKDAFDKVTEARLKLLSETIGSYKLLARTRILFEGIVPLLIGIISVSISVYKLL